MWKNIARYTIVIICGVVIVARAICPGLRFDNISLIIFMLGSIVILLPELRDIIGRVKKFKMGDFEVELAEKLEELAVKTDNAEIMAGERAKPEMIFHGINDEVVGKLAQASSDPRAALLLIAIEIEQVVRSLAEQVDIQNSRRYPISKLLHLLAEKQVITPEVVPIFQDFWTIRNQVVHGHHFELSTGKLYELVELGVRILRLLSMTKLGSKNISNDSGAKSIS